MKLIEIASTPWLIRFSIAWICLVTSPSPLVTTRSKSGAPRRFLGAVDLAEVERVGQVDLDQPDLRLVLAPTAAVVTRAAAAAAARTDLRHVVPPWCADARVAAIPAVGKMLPVTWMRSMLPVTVTTLSTAVARRVLSRSIMREAEILRAGSTPLAGEARQDHLARPCGPSPSPARAPWSASATPRGRSRDRGSRRCRSRPGTAMPSSRQARIAPTAKTSLVKNTASIVRRSGADRAQRLRAGLGQDRRLVVHDVDRRRRQSGFLHRREIALGAMAGALVVLARPVDEDDAAVAGPDQLARSSHAPPRGWNSRPPCRPARRRSPRSRRPGCRSSRRRSRAPLVWVRPVSTIASGRRSRIERIWLSSTSVR